MSDEASRKSFPTTWSCSARSSAGSLDCQARTNPMRAAIFVTPIVLVACAPAMDQQRPPFYVASAGNGMCGGSTIADSTGIVGSEAGCEEHSTGWKVHRMSAASRDRMVRAFEALPPPGNYCAQPVDGNTVTLRIDVAAGKPLKQWVYCGDAKGQAEKFHTAVESLDGE